LTSFASAGKAHSKRDIVKDFETQVDADSRERERQIQYLISSYQTKTAADKSGGLVREARLCLSGSSGASTGDIHSTSCKPPDSTPLLTIANFIEMDGFAGSGSKSKIKKTALEKDQMWEELMRRSDLAPSGTLQAKIKTSLPSDLISVGDSGADSDSVNLMI
jgi:hypothetical protein